jgi:hypothetical protein
VGRIEASAESMEAHGGGHGGRRRGLGAGITPIDARERRSFKKLQVLAVNIYNISYNTSFFV